MQSPGGERLLTAANAQALIGRDRSAVWDGTRLAVVWTNQPLGQDHTILMRRFDMNGRPVGPELPIFTGPIEADPAIAWSGSGYGIVWSDEDFGLPRILFAHVDVNGQLTTTATQVSTIDQSGTRPTIAWNGSEFIVAWSWYTTRLHARRITAAGVTLDSVTCLNCSGPSGTGEISIAVAHTNFVGFAYADFNGSIKFLQTTKTLALAGGPINLATLTGSDQPWLVWDGSAWAALWFDRRQANEGIYFNRISTTPAELLASDVRINAVEQYSSSPTMVWSGSEFIAGWIGGPGPPWNILTRRFDATGTPLNATQYYGISNYNRCHTTMVWTGSRPIFVRDEDEIATTSPIRARLFDCCSDSDADGASWCAGDTDDRDTSVFPGAGELCDGRDNDGDGQLDESGCDRDCALAPFTQDPVLEYGSTIQATLSIRGSETFVSHVDTFKPGIQLALRRGGPPWSSPIPLESDTANSDQLTSSWAGDRTITIWRDLRGGTSQLRGSAIDRFGAALWIDRPLVAGPGSFERPQVVWGARRALVAFLQGAPATLRFTLLTPDGSRLLDNSRLDTGDLTASVEYAAARDPRGGFVVIWIEPQGAGSSKRLRVARLDEEGSIAAGPVELVATTLPLNTPRIVPVSTGFLTLWNGPDAGSAHRAMRRTLDAALQPTNLAQPFGVMGTLLSGSEALVWTGSEIVMIIPETATESHAQRWRFDEAGNSLDNAVPIGSVISVESPEARWDGSGIRTLWKHRTRGPNSSDSTGRINCALSSPGLVHRLFVTSSSSLAFNWDPAEGASLYDLVSGPIGGSADRCEFDNIPATSASLPVPSGERFFLVRSDAGSWDDNSPGLNTPRSVTACP